MTVRVKSEGGAECATARCRRTWRLAATQCSAMAAAMAAVMAIAMGVTLVGGLDVMRAVAVAMAMAMAVKLVEVTRAKEVVWRYQGQPAGFHHFQILTTNGTPVKDNTWK